MVVLSIAAPTALFMLNDSANARLDAMQTTRAIWMVNAILEECAADAMYADGASGYDAMENEPAYVAGLRARLDDSLADYEPFGLTWQVDLDPVVVTTTPGGPRAVAQPGLNDPDYRRIAATVQWSTHRGETKTLNVDIVVARP